MPDTDHAVLQDREGRPALLFERLLAHSPERVWRALSAGEDLQLWHPTPFELRGGQPAPGTHVSFIAIPGAPEMPAGHVLAYDPPRLLAHTWGNDELWWELEGREGGCLLRLTHIFDDRLKAARDATGWHLCLGALSSALDLQPRPLRGVEPSLPPGWSELNGDYERRFGIDPDQATPPPSAGGS
jgi:uncharacterized protein YndB with AHSA1/START domain